MSVWLIEPLDPLIARDGRPAAVGRFDTMEFPYPSMLAGAVRTRMGSEGGAFTLPKSALGELREKVLVRGPLLAEVQPEGGITSWFAPAPHDAVLREENGVLRLRRLFPRPLAAGEAMDSLPGHGLLPLRTAGIDIYGKPPKNIPSFWSWSRFERWLTEPQDEIGVTLADLGIGKLPVETRVHLAIKPDERVGMDGMLFQTAGLRFLQKDESPLGMRWFALSVQVGEARVAGRDLALERQIAPLGGERRLARWSPASAEWPQMPNEIRKNIVDTRRARLLLLTPAIFENGFLPGWNGQSWPLGGGVEAIVRAAAVPRPAIISGWNLETGQAKHTRRLAAAGSVYFLELRGGTDEAIGDWCDAAWLGCVSDNEQDRRDGFGMAVLGTWEAAQ